MAVRFIQLGTLKRSGCGASRDKLTLVRSRRAAKGTQVICTDIYHCRVCQHQTGIIRAEPQRGTASVAEARARS